MFETDEQKTEDQKTVDELREKFPNAKHIHKLTAPTGEAVWVRRPDMGTYRRFRTHIQDERRKLDAPENLLKACLLQPTPKEFDLMLEDRPGLLDTFANELMVVAGLAKEVEKKAF